MKRIITFWKCQPGSQTGAMFLFCPILDSFVCLYNFFTNKNI